MNSNGFLASEKMEISVSNQDIIPDTPKDWNRGYVLKSFSFVNSSDCTVLVNDKIKMFLRAGQGFNTTWNDPDIFSFKILEDDIEYNWIGVY